MNAIPTTYKGVRFRSRLEARWAAFFDLASWPWLYEPIDLDGYIPDFVVERRGRPKRLVEVKPALEVGELALPSLKIMASGWDGVATVVGARLFRERDLHLGINGRVHAADAPIFQELLARHLELQTPELAVYVFDEVARHGWKPWRGEDALEPLWVEAGNVVQWRGR